MSGWRTDAVLRSAALRLQRRYRQNVHAVGPLVRRTRKADYNRQGLRRMSASFGYAPFDLKQMLSGGFLLVDAKLDLDRRPFSVRHLDYGVDLPVAVVLVMVNRGVKRLCVAQEVAQYKALEEEAEGVQVALKPRGIRLEKRGGYGRVAEAALLSLLYACAGAEGRGERAYVFGHEEAFKGIQVGGKSFLVKLYVAGGKYVALNGGHVRSCRFVACEGTQQQFHFVSVVVDLVNSGNLPVKKSANIGGWDFYGLCKWTVDGFWPAAAHYEFNYFGKLGSAIVHNPAMCTFADSFKGDFAFADAAFPKAHGTHSETGDAAGARVVYSLLWRCCGASQYESSMAKPFVDMRTGCIPDGWENLPFVNQAWFGTDESVVDVHSDALLNCKVVGRICDGTNARGLAHGGPCFSAPHWALYADCTKSLKMVCKNLVGNSWHVIFDIHGNSLVKSTGIVAKLAYEVNCDSVKFVKKIPSNSEYLFRNIRKNYSMKFASLNVVNSDFPMYQIRTFRRGRFGSVDHIRQCKATQNLKLRCLDAETFANSLSVTDLSKSSFNKTMNNKTMNNKE